MLCGLFFVCLGGEKEKIGEKAKKSLFSLKFFGKYVKMKLRPNYTDSGKEDLYRGV